MSETKKLIPKRRFKEFQNAGEWEQRKLGENATFLKGQGYSKKDLVEKGEPIILYGRLYTNYETIIREVDTYVEAKLDSIISNGTEVIVPASGETAEDIARASAVYNSGIILGGDLNIIYPEKKINSAFLALSISNGYPQKELSTKAQGKSVVHLRNTDLKNLKINFACIDEQKKISKYFEELDNLITLQQRKLEKITSMKKAYLYEMFPAEGESKPKRRFKGFSDEWEHCKLIDMLSQPISDGPHETPKLFERGIPFISVDAIVNNKIDFSRVRGFISEKYHLECCKKYKPALHDVFLVKSGSTVGKVAIVQSPQQFNIWSPLAAMRCNEANDSYFLYHLLQTKKIQGQVFDKCSHGTQPNLSMRQLEKFDVRIPSIDEQRKIKDAFNSLDELVTLTQHKLDKLKNLKKSYLNEMFI